MKIRRFVSLFIFNFFTEYCLSIFTPKCVHTIHVERRVVKNEKKISTKQCVDEIKNTHTSNEIHLSPLCAFMCGRCERREGEINSRPEIIYFICDPERGISICRLANSFNAAAAAATAAVAVVVVVARNRFCAIFFLSNNTLNQ